jgi:hypothetical protein
VRHPVDPQAVARTCTRSDIRPFHAPLASDSRAIGELESIYLFAISLPLRLLEGLHSGGLGGCNPQQWDVSVRSIILRERFKSTVCVPPSPQSIEDDSPLSFRVDTLGTALLKYRTGNDHGRAHALGDPRDRRTQNKYNAYLF